MWGQRQRGFLSDLWSRWLRTIGDTTSGTGTGDYGIFTHLLLFRILVYNPISTYLLLNGTLWNALMKITQPHDCTGCKLLSATDGCLLSGNSCTNNAAIFCCDSCQSVPQVCLLHGNTIITSGKLVEWRISSGGEQLLLTNAFDMGDNTAIMVSFSTLKDCHGLKRVL